MRGDAGRAMVTFQAPHGVEATVLDDDQVVEFGRGASCGIRFGFAPIADLGVPRVAGALLVTNGRVIVESRSDVGNRVLEIGSAGQPVFQLAHGAAFAPPGDSFSILVHGESNWSLQVTVRSRATTAHLRSGDAPTTSVDVPLTPTQRKVLDAYAAPVMTGRVEPATHSEVSTALSYSPGHAREVLYQIYARMFAAGLPMPDVGDKRVAVVESARLHGMVAQR